MGFEPFAWPIIIAAALVATYITFVSAKNFRGKGEYLCEDCKFNDPDSCKKEERPKALVCTSYRAKI